MQTKEVRRCCYLLPAVTLAAHLAAPVPLALPVPDIAWRAGIDLSPLDPLDPDDAAWLSCRSVRFLIGFLSAFCSRRCRFPRLRGTRREGDALRMPSAGLGPCARSEYGQHRLRVP